MVHVNEVRLVDEAARILAEDGPAGLSLRKVAAAAGLSTMPVYTLFGDKQGLLAAMHREGFRRLGAALAAVPHTDEPLQDLVALGFAYREAALASPHLYGLMFGRSVPHFEPSEADREAADATFHPVLEAATRCQEAGVFTAGDPRRIALHLWAVSHGMISLELNGQLPDEAPPEALYAEALTFAGHPFIP